MDISMLPPELTINIAEHMDITTLFQLMSTNKRFHSLIQSHERSICKEKMQHFTPLHARGSLLSSSGVERYTHQPLTFRAILELERRDTRINAILDSGFVDLASPPGLDPLSPVQQGRLAKLLRRSLYHCDAIADVAGNVPGVRLPDYDYTLISSGIWNMASGLPLGARHQDPFTNIQARPAQIKYLGTLPVEDLAGLYLTITAMSSGHIRDRPALQYDPSFAERITVFEECVLRHGTWFLWAQAVLGDTKETAEGTGLALREMTGHMLLAGFAELIGWETGDEELPPGLRMSLLDAAKRHFEDEERPIVYQLYNVLRDMIFGAEKNGDEHRGD